MDSVNGRSKPVLEMIAYNADDPSSCKSEDLPCRKRVTSSGAIITSDIYASGVYSVVAKVPPASGLIWAVWMYHYELHLPGLVIAPERWID